MLSVLLDRNNPKAKQIEFVVYSGLESVLLGNLNQITNYKYSNFKAVFKIMAWINTFKQLSNIKYVKVRS